MFRKTLRFFLVLCFSLCILCDGASANEDLKVAELNQGWSQQEIQFYNHASEGSNLAPLEFVLSLPDSADPESKFIDKISSRYGFRDLPENKIPVRYGYRLTHPTQYRYVI